MWLRWGLVVCVFMFGLLFVVFWCFVCGVDGLVLLFCYFLSPKKLFVLNCFIC